MGEKWMLSPPNVRALAFEIKRLMDAYWAREVDLQEVYLIIKHWSECEKDKLYSKRNPENFNPTILCIIGQKRSGFLAKVIYNDVLAKNLFKIQNEYTNFREGVREAK